MSNATPLPAPDDNSYIWSANDFSNIINQNKYKIYS